MLDLSYMFKDMTERNIKRTNPFSGESEMLTEQEAKLYDQIKLDEQFYKIKNKKIDYIFNPHLIPTFRGILSSIYLDLGKGVTLNKIIIELKKYYKKNKFIKIHKKNKSIGTGNVLETNNCEISVCKTRIKGKIVIFSAIDNLVKGASGQAIQNMNIRFNFKISEGLK